MAMQLDNPLIVQSDRTILLEVDRTRSESARDFLALFAELEKSPEHVHTYRITSLSLWNAAAAGMHPAEIVEGLKDYSKYDVPAFVISAIHDMMGRFGRVKIFREGESLLLRSEDVPLIEELFRHKKLVPYILGRLDAMTLLVDGAMRGHIKQALITIGYPAEDIAGYTNGDPLSVTLRTESVLGKEFQMRHYQHEAVEIFYAHGASTGGSGVVVLPCGAGKTIVGLGVLAAVGSKTLILTPNTVAVRQWISEILDKTSLTEADVGEYSGEHKDIRSITVSTYQILTYRNSANEFPHFSLMTGHNWGLIIYDEVHLLPAPIFRVTAEIQARRRLGLTATLVREDGRESDVFSLIGPKKYDVPWRDLERQGWIATAECHEMRVAFSEDERMRYAVSEDREKYRIAAENPRKIPLVQRLIKRHRGKGILVIGQYIEQLQSLAELLNAPVLTGKTPTAQRQKLYDGFRSGEIGVLVVSKVANFAIDLPDASVAIQVSGTFGSRQEEAQRLGRLLRPKSDNTIAQFYTIITRDSRDQDFAANRQIFLTEQGYRYSIENGDLDAKGT